MAKLVVSGAGCLVHQLAAVHYNFPCLHQPNPSPPAHTPATHLHQVGGQAAAAVRVEVGQRGRHAGHSDAGAHRQLHHAAPGSLPARRDRQGGMGREGW